MADVLVYDPSLDPSSEQYRDPHEDPVATWKDYGYTLLRGTANAGADLAAGARGALDAGGFDDKSAIAKFAQHAMEYGASRADQSISKGGHEQLEAALTDPAFLEHPISSSFMKALDMTPMVAASVAPALFLPGVGALIGAAGVGAGLSGGHSARDAYNLLDDQSDDELQQKVPFYNGLRMLGKTEEQARAETATKLMGYKPLLNAVVGGAAMVMGPAGRIAGGITEAGGGLLSRVGMDAAEGGYGMGLMSGVEEGTRESMVEELDPSKPMDSSQILAAAAQGALTGGVLGAVGGVLPHRGGEPVARAEDRVQVVDARGPDAAQSVALSDTQARPEPVAPTMEASNAAAPSPAGDIPAGASRVLTSEPKPVTPEGNIDTPTTGPVPEAPATFEAQTQQLIDGQRKAVLYPKGTKDAVTLPEGMKRTQTKDGTWVYDPNKISRKQIYEASKANRINEVLDLGEFNKTDLAPRIAAGEQPLAVTERAPDGTEVKAAAGTEGTAPSQIATLEATKTPGNTVQVEPGQRVLQDRIAAAQAATRELTPPPVDAKPSPVKPQVAERIAKAKVAKQPKVVELTPEQHAAIEQTLDRTMARMEAFKAQGVKVPEDFAAFREATREKLVAKARAELAPPAERKTRAAAQDKGEGKHYTNAQIEKRMADTAAARDIVERHAPTAEEEANASNAVGREMTLERVRRMLTEANDRKVKIPDRIKRITERIMDHSPHSILLSEAKALAKERGRAVSREELHRFRLQEKLLRSGREEDRALALENRRVEGDEKFAARATERQTENVASKEPREEEHVEADQKELESVADEGREVHEAVEEAEDDSGPTPPSREREKVALKGDEVQAVKDRAGTFAVTTRRRIARTIKSLGGDLKVNIDHAMSVMPSVKSLQQSSLSSLLSRHDAGNEGVHSVLFPYISRRLARIAGDVQVHIVSKADIDKMVPGAGGFYVSEAHDGRPRIYIGDDVAANPNAMRHVLVHEGMHAAVEHALNVDAHAHFGATLIMDEVHRYVDRARQHLTDSDMRYLERVLDYGMTDVHEFMSEAMSNPRFQEILGQIPASREIQDYFQLKNPITLRDSIVQFLRKILGLQDGQHALIEAALRVNNQLMRHAETYGARGMRGKLRAIKDEMEKPLPTLRAVKAGNFTPEGNATNTRRISEAFRPTFTESLNREINGAKEYVGQLTRPAQFLSDTISTAKNHTGIATKALNAVTTNDQYAQRVQHLLPNAREITDAIEKTGVRANQLKERGMELTADLIHAGKKYPQQFDRFQRLLIDQTQYGVDASHALGEGTNSHLRLSKELQDKLAKGTAGVHEGAMSQWEARAAHPELKRRYDALVKEVPEFAQLQRDVFKFYSEAQSAMARGQIDAVLRGYGFKGTAAERAAAVEQVHGGKMTDEQADALAAKLDVTPDGAKQAIKHIQGVDSLTVKNGPYVPLTRHGDHVILGEYKVEAPTNATKINDDTYEFKTREEAHKWAVHNGLNSKTKIVYYDPNTGLRVKTKSDAISQTGSPDARYQVTVDRQHFEMHETISEARARVKELQDSGLFAKLGTGERRQLLGENASFTGRGVDSLLRSLSQQKAYQEATPLEQGMLRHTIREAGLRSMSDHRVQSRRLPRRNVKGASNDAARSMYEYNNSQANYRAKLENRQAIDDGMKAMWKHVADNVYTNNYEGMTKAANEMERRVNALDPNEYSGAYSDWSRRVMTWSYIDRMMRPSHLILHQTHLPMITAPYMAGRHGVMNAFGTTLGAWKELTGAYAAGGRDAWAHTVSSALSRGVDHTTLAKEATKTAPDAVRLHQMFDKLAEIGLIHPSAGLEVGKYLPNREATGIVGGVDRGLNKLDTIFRDLTNATEAINRHAGAMAAYRMEYKRLTREGKANAHEGAIEYARKTLSETQGLYSSTNAPPIFKNKYLRPFLQFKQFPQMMYNLLGGLAKQALKGETRQAKIEAISSLASILAMHSLMAGVIQGIPLEPFKLAGLITKGVGLTDGDWTDVEDAMRRSITANLGEDVGRVVTHGIGSELFGVDVHHRLGLNSFVTFGMPDQLDSKSVSDFMLNAVGGAPYGLVKDMVQGTHMMLNGDVQNGALKAFPLQALRDVRNAISPQPNKYGYEATGVDRVKSVLGFTPAEKAAAAERKSAVYNAIHEYDDRRREFIDEWVAAAPADRADVWKSIQDWNETLPPSSRLNKGDLYKSLTRSLVPDKPGTKVDYLKTNTYNRAIAQRASDTYH